MAPAHARAPLGSMMVRVAELWRLQGTDFIEQSTTVLEEDVARLRGAIREEAPAERHGLASAVGPAVDRLKGWDQAVVEALRNRRAEHDYIDLTELDALVDLTGPDPVVGGSDRPVPRINRTAAGTRSCARHDEHDAAGPCRKCRQPYCDECLVSGRGRSRLCVDCAMVVSGIHRGH